jgi:phosphoserine phosphatase
MNLALFDFDGTITVGDTFVPFMRFAVRPGRLVLGALMSLHGYLLSTSHPVGRFKARFFAALGYTAENWQEFEADLRAQHLTEDAELSASMPEGQVFTIRAILN